MATALSEVWTFRPLVWNFAQRELKAKYKGSALGWLWSLINPIATLAVYTVVFATIFRAQPPPFADGSKGNYTLFLFTGLIVWTFFNATVNGSMLSLISVGPLLRKIWFPPLAPVAGSVAANGVQTLIELAVLVLVMVLIGNVSLPLLLFLPVLLVLLALFSLGIGLMLSVWNVYYRDVSYLVGLALQVIFYATPVIYPPSLIPPEAHGLPLRDLLEANPVAQFVAAFREVLYDLQAPSVGRMLTLVLLAGTSIAVGSWVFQRRAHDVSEEL